VIAKPQQVGLREHNKRDKLRRIKAAATELFSLKGYDAATTRAIAKRARVSHATIFKYAKDKNELAYLIFCDKLEVAHRESFAAITPEMSLMEQLVTAFSGGYREYMKDTTLGRVMLKTSSEFQFGEQAKRVQGHRAELIAKLAELIANARRSEVIQTEEDPEFIARDLFGSVYASMRFWLAKETPDTSKGLGDLSRIIRLHIRALEPTSEAFARRADSEMQAQIPESVK
jgi:AcrR family transcriptional regulator